MKISSLSPALKKKRNVLCTRNLSFLISLVLLLNLTSGIANAATVGITTVFPEQYDSLSRRAVPFPMPEDGTITSVAMYHDGSSGGMILAVYDNGGDDKPDNRIAITAETPTNPSAGWQTIDLISPVFANAGAKIWLAWVYEGPIYHRVGDTTIEWGRAKTSPAKYWADTPKMPATFGSCELGHPGTSSIYATYTPGSGTQVGIIGSWISGTSHTVETDPNRALIFTAHTEDDNSDMDITSVTYGGQAMTKIIDRNFGIVRRVYVAAFILDDAGITAASNSNFVVTWDQVPFETPAYSSVFLSRVDQTYPLSYVVSAAEGGTYVISTDPLTTSYGDMVILAGTCGTNQTYEVGPGSGFIEAIELSRQYFDGIAAYKSATGADETPSTQHSTVDRKVIIGFVLQTEGASPPDTDPPDPDPSTWASEPHATTNTIITMTATEAADDSGVQYYFDETSGNPGGTDSGWQASSIYIDSGLTPQTQYTYRVKTRDQCTNHNEGSWSDPNVSATTPEVSVATGCPQADLTNNCVVDWEDLKCLTDQWLVSDCISIPPGCACADLDGHTLVDFNDYAMFVLDWGKKGTTLRINELMPENDSNVPDPCGEYDDWFEIYNLTSEALDIGGMWVENDDRDWQIPTGYPETIIPPGGHIVLWADRDTHQGPLHVDFRLDKDGDHIDLYADANGQPGILIDTITYDDSDVLPDYSYGRFPDANDSWYTMDDPTPWLPNTIGMARPPYFSHPGGTFSTNFSVGLTTKSPTAQIYYTTNGDEPTDSSTPYTGTPIDITETTWLRAIAYDPPIDPSYIVSKSYIKLDPDVQSFESNLPIVIIDSFGTDIDEANRNFHPVISAFIDTDEITGRAAITDAADYSGYGGMHIRGASTADYPKKQFRFETWDEYGEDKAVSLLGLPSESDWIIHGPWSDRTQMRNYQMYTWSNLIGRYASRTIFIEVFTDYDGNGKIEWDSGLDGSNTDYRGVYVLMEKIKRDDNRVDIERLEPQHDSEPEITGGYLFEKGGGSDVETVIYGDSFSYSDPESYELTMAQKTWVTNYFNAFEADLSGGNYNNPAHADYYGNYIDIGSFIDHHILVETAKNVDGFLLSTFLYKDRGGKINMGPIWDYNGSLGGADYICNWVPEGWLYEAHDEVCCPSEDCCPFEDSCWRHLDPDEVCEGNDLPNHYNWYVRLFEDPNFLLKYADHWFEFREDVFDSSNMDADISNNADVLTDSGAGDNPANRNYARWDNLTDNIWPDYLDNEFWLPGCTSAYPHTYAGHVQWLRDWLSARLTWMDIAIDTGYGDTPPEIFLNGSPADQGSHANVGDSVTITGGTIYYTTDGNDPRNYDGGIYGDPYSPITLNKSVQIKARIRYSPTNWSALNEATFAVGPVADNLRITEMMYHPQDTGDPINDPNAEFIELKNIHGSTTINLNLVKFTDGIDFTFPDISLNAGDYIVVAKDLTLFAARYPAFSGTVVGPYLGRLNNAGERVTLEDAIGQVILNFSFKDGWYHITDGSGFSLNIIDPTDDPNSWEYSEGWRASSIIKGTPGADDTGHVAAPGDIVINEVMTHTDISPEDWIELHNTTSSPIDIGGWFLSDNDSDFMKYEIAPGTSIAGDGYIVFTEDANFNAFGSDPGCHFPFALSEHGETVYLSSGSASVLDGGFCAKEDFKAAENGVTFGRYTKSPATANDVDFVAMSSPTSEAENTAGPKVGPVVISEIMYHPATSGQLNNYAEYVELYNISGGSVSLDDWQLTDEDGGIEFYIPAGTSLPSGQRLLLVKNLVAFVAEFGAPIAQAFEWVEGRLSNAGEKIQISKPGPPEPDFIPYIRVDRVNYSDGSHPENFHELPGDPWPTGPDGGGDSLHRVTPGNYGNDVANWVSGAVSPGS